MAESAVGTTVDLHGGFNWIFLIWSLVCGIIAIFFLFFFNRLFATLVGYAIRAYTWRKYKAYIDISSLQISLLGGRVFFKSIRYHAQNVTVLVYEGHITWRYWLRAVQDAEIFEVEESGRKRKERSASAHEDSKSGSDEKEGDNEKPRSGSVGKEERGGGKPKKELPCRISVKVAGVEAFVYNRGPVYDSVLEQTLRKAQEAQDSAERSGKGRNNEASPSSSDSNVKGRLNGFTAEKVKTNETTGMSSLAQISSAGAYKKPELPAFLRMFPIRIECRRAAAALGNENTTSVIAAKLAKAAGTIDVGHAGPLDLYKLLFNFDMENINVTMKPNRDFKQYQLDAAQRILQERDVARTPSKRFYSKCKRYVRKRWHSVRDVFRRRNSIGGSLRTASIKSNTDEAAMHLGDQIPGQAQWHGLARYLDDSEPTEHDEWKDVEYAKAATLADIEKLHMRFYFDMPGQVPPLGLTRIESDASSAYDDDMNGSKPPDYGLDFTVHGGLVTYGPWTDRQRINLQQIFVPAPYVDATPAAPLKPGETRNWSLFKIFVLVEKDITLRVPTREPSKDDKWQGRADKYKSSEGQDNNDNKRKHRHGRRHRHTRRRKDKQGNLGLDARPAGWIDVTVKTDSTINYTMDMFSRSVGYMNSLDMDVKGTEITSSVNNALLWRTGAVTLNADISQPAPWKALRKWPFDIQIDGMELFILRDHFFLIIDMVNDWSSGAASEFHTFVPYMYSLRMLFRNFAIYLNVNDANIVNDPADFDKNDFLTLEGLLDSTLDIDMSQYRPVRNMITFDVITRDMRMRMLSPTKTTYNAFLKDKVVATLPKLTMKGSYSGHMEERPGLTDTLRFDIVGTGLTLKAHGFVVRQLINIKENLFGDYMHFKTLEEFQGADEDLAIANVKTASLPKPTSINELDVMLCIIAEDVTVLAPTSMYSCHEFVRAELPVANLDLRILSYYLDMGLQLSPVTLLSGSKAADDDSPIVDGDSSTQLFVKHVDLDGHRSFGLPPDEPPYISQWDIDIGAITGEMSSSFVHDLAMAARAFIFGFADRENAVPLGSPSTYYEATFVQVRTDILRIWMHVGNDALLFSSDPVEVVTNDWAGDTFSQRINVVAPKITLACVDGRSASRHRIHESRRAGGRAAVRTYAFFQTGAAINVVIRKSHFEQEKAKQQRYIRENDRRTQRTPFLLRHGYGSATAGISEPDMQPPAMPYPFLPPPINNEGSPSGRPSSIKSIPSYASRDRVSTKSSSSSLSASVKRGGPTAPFAMAQNKEALPYNSTTSSERIKGSSRASSRSSSKRHSVLPSDHHRAAFGLPPSTMAFSSSFAEPYFPLDLIEPDETNVPQFASGGRNQYFDSDQSSIAETIDDPQVEGDAAQVAVLIQLAPGIRAYAEPSVALTGLKLFRNVLPQNPEEVLDTYQTDVLGTLAARQESHLDNRQTLASRVDLAEARVRVANPISQEQGSDQLDLNLRSIDLVLRSRNEVSSDGTPKNLAVRATAEGVLMTFGRGAQSLQAEPIITLSIDDIIVWLAFAKAISAHATVGDTIFAASGEQAEYVFNAIVRLLPLIDQLKTMAVGTLEAQRNRLLLLIHTLTREGDEIGDPPFLSRMTYILRAFPNHFRNQESWKILSRLRYMLQNLPRKSLDELKVKIKHVELNFPADPAKALIEWAQWKNWDVPNIHQTIAFQILFDELEDQGTRTPEQMPMALTLRLNYLRLAVEAGGDANEVVIEDISLGLDSTPPTNPTGLMLVDANMRTKTMLQLHTTSVAISVRWCLLGIVEQFLPLGPQLQELSFSKPADKAENVTTTWDDILTRHVFQLVASVDNGSVSLESLNLRHVSRADGLKISLIGTTNEGEQYGPCACALLNADSAVTELFGQFTRIWQTVLTSPSIYADHVMPLPGVDLPPSVNVAVAYKSLQLTLLEQMPGVMQVVDAVIIDEVAKVLEVMDHAKKIAPAKPTEKVSPRAGLQSAVKLHLALLAGDLQVEVSLLQALKYRLAGTAASVRVAPSLSRDQAWSIDYDVGRQTHCFINSSVKNQQQQSILDVPRINGHIGLEFNRAAISLSVGTTVQQIEVDATAVNGVLAVINRPEVQNVISAINGSADDIKAHIDDLGLGKKPYETVEKRDIKQIAFDVRIALLGINVTVSTPQGRGSSTATIAFGIGPVYATASNRETLNESKSLIPQVRARIHDIGAELQVHEKDRKLPCGNVTFGLDLRFDSRIDDTGKLARALKVQSRSLEINAYPETASTVVDVINHLQDKIRDLDLSTEKEYLRRLRDSRKEKVIQRTSGKQEATSDGEVAFSAVDLLSMTTTVELRDIKVAWLVNKAFATGVNGRVADLVLSLDRIELATRGGQEARLTIEDTQLQLARHGSGLTKRSMNSAILPHVSFSVAYWTTGKLRSFAFKAAGTPLEIRLESTFMYPVNAVQRSIESAIENFKTGTATWQGTPTTTGAPRQQLFDTKRIAHVLMEADFAGAHFFLEGSGPQNHSLATLAAASQQHGSQHGRYGQFAAEGTKMQTTFKAPGIALKVEYNANTDNRQPTINGEIRIDASNNMLLPNVVPLVLEVSHSVKEVMQSRESATPTNAPQTAETRTPQRFFEDESVVTADPTAIFGKTKVDLGLRICRQEFGLTCQPIARVDATAQMEDLYVTMNTIASDEHGHFFALTAAITKLGAQVKHMYSREPTFNFDMDSVVLSVLNSKHLSGTPGISTILKINPTRTFINGKQLQDLLLFREIWLPPEIRSTTPAPQPTSSRADEFIVQKYHTVAAAAAFPWNATVSIAELAVELDLGQSIGKSSFTINNLWASQTKSSNWEQNLCIGMEEMAMNSKGRMSGFIRLNKLGVRMAIKWQQDIVDHNRTPLIQASVGFQRLLAKAAFDYQAFAFGDIEDFDFLMYNVHQAQGGARDRLVAVLDCEKAFVFCTATSPAQAVGLYQAFDRLIQEKQTAFIQSLRDIEKHVRRESTVVPTRFGPTIPNSPVAERPWSSKTTLSMHTDVVLTMGAISFGVFPSTFFDSQILKLEANNIQARFAVGLERGKISSGLGMTLGQLQVALASVRRVTAVPKALDISVDEVISSAVNARGGTILRVPKVIASMQTWQAPESNSVDYIFKSLFDGKIDVGWNLSRIDFIKNMWVAHSRSLASRLGKALPESAVKITAGPAKDGEARQAGDSMEGQDKITAEVNLPQSKYEYNALETPIIETPQLRDMGEATPPLEWIGLQRDRLPNVTHQIIIVSLLEVAKEVEDAYQRILGSS